MCEIKECPYTDDCPFCHQWDIEEMIALSKIPNDMVAGTIHKNNNYGDMEVVRYVDSGSVRIRFLDTGMCRNASSSEIRMGRVKDKCAPIIFGVGYIGYGDFNQASNASCNSVWRSMMARCYSEEVQLKQPTYVGCTVDSSWHNFQNFAAWFYDNYIEGFQVDKDKMVKGNKVYGPDTCCFLSSQENNEISLSKTYTMLSPLGELVTFTNANRFSRENGLSQPNLSAVLSGRRRSCRGWTLPSEDLIKHKEKESEE